MGKFDNIKVGQTTSTLPQGVGRFDNVQVSSTNKFSNITSTSTQENSKYSFGGLVGKLGDVLTAPQRLTTGLIQTGLEKKGVLKQDGGLAQSNIELLKKYGEQTGKGGLLTGQYTPTTSVFGNFIRELPVTALGTLADIFLDPLTLVGGAGGIKKVTTEIGKVGETAFKSLAKEIPAVQKVGDILGKAFVTRYGQSEAFKGLDIGRKIEESFVKENVGKLVSDIIEKPQFIQQRITQMIKGLDLGTPELKGLADPIRQELDRVGESISKLNPKLLSEETFAANKGTYFPRLYTTHEFATDENIVNQVFSGRAVSVPKQPFMARKLTEAESVAMGTRIEEAGYPALKRLTQLNIVESRQKFFKEVAKIASDEAKPGFIQLSSDKSLGDLAGKFLPAPEYKAIADIRHIPTGIEEVYNKALTTWKTFKTAYNPATISRNDITNYFILNPLGGVGPHRLDIYAKTANEIMSKGQLYQLARKEGLEISTQQAAELGKKAERFYSENKNLVGKIFDKVSNFHEAVKNFYGSQDKFFKLSNFIKGVTEDGLTPTEAMKRANFYMVDYSEVPAVVDWLRKSPVGIPFISFTYGVSKPLAKTLLEHPEKLATYFKIFNGIQQMNPLGETPQQLQNEKNVLPDWISSGTYLRLPFKDTGGRSQYTNLQYILPFNVIEGTSMKPSNPLMNITASVLVNRDAFTGKDIYLSTDTQTQKVEKVFKNVLGQLLPSFTPGVGTSFDKVVNTLKGRPDKQGFVKTKLETFLDIIGGVKITPIDPTVEAQIRASEKQKQLQALYSELKKIILDKSIFPQEKQKQVQELQTKVGEVYNKNQ